MISLPKLKLFKFFTKGCCKPRGHFQIGLQFILGKLGIRAVLGLPQGSCSTMGKVFSCIGQKDLLLIACARNQFKFESREELIVNTPQKFSALTGATVMTEREVIGLDSQEKTICICSGDVQAQVETAQVLREAGIPCAEFRVESFPDYLEMLKICTQITEHPEYYKEYGEKVSSRIQELKQKLPAGNDTLQVLFIRSGNSASSAKAKTAEEHFGAAMAQELGAHNIADDVPVLLEGLSVEEILQKDPDVILITTMGKEAAAKEYMDSVLATDVWRSLTALKEGRCYYLPKDLFQFKPNARWDQAYLYLAKLLFPEIEWE